MSISRQVTVWCDECAQWDQSTGTARELRKELARRGWTQKGTKDFCPKCSPSQENTK